MPQLHLKDVKSLDGQISNLSFEGPKDETIECHGKLVAMPSLIDPHVRFRVPGHTYKEDVITGAKAAIAGGITRIFDMPDNEPQTTTEARLDKKNALIQTQLNEAKIPLRFNLFFGADDSNLEEIPKVRKKIAGIKLYMGGSPGTVNLDSQKGLDRLFQIAAELDLIIAVQAEDHQMIMMNQDIYKHSSDVKSHSLIRSRDGVIRATERALDLAMEHSAEVYFCDVSTKEEVDLIRDAKDSQQLAWMEVTPNHLFLTDEDYETLGTRVQINPPLRTRQDQWALWEAVIDGTADTLGSNHSPHTLVEKTRPYPHSLSGAPGLETMLPLLLNAHSQGKISLTRIVELCRLNIESIFQIPTNNDLVIVDLSLVKSVEEAMLKTKCGWSPFAGRELKGWPVATIINGQAFHI